MPVLALALLAVAGLIEAAAMRYVGPGIAVAFWTAAVVAGVRADHEPAVPFGLDLAADVAPALRRGRA